MSKAQYVQIKSTEFQPKNEFLLVKPAEVERTEQKTESGIVLAIKPQASALDRPSSGTVLAIGRDIDDIKEGDFVLWPNTDGIDLEFTDGVFTLLRYKSVIGSKK